MWKSDTSFSRHPEENRFGQCCAKNIMYLVLGDNPIKQRETVAFIEEALKDDDFVTWCGSWRTRAMVHPAVWLADQLAKFQEKQVIPKK